MPNSKRLSEAYEISPRYSTWLENIRGHNIDIFTYIMYNYTTEDMFLISEIFCPTLVKHKSVYFLEDTSIHQVDSWLDHFNGDMVLTQKMLNKFNIGQLFYRDDSNQDHIFEMFKRVTQLVAACWRGYFEKFYPEMKFEVLAYYDEEDFEPFITFWNTGIKEP